MALTHGKHDSLPEARAEALLSEQVGDELVVYDLTSKAVHCLSPLASAVFAHCDGRTDPSRIADVAEERLGRPVSVDEVSAAVEQLEERSLLATPPLVFQDGNGVSRRDLMKKSALAGAAVVAAPLITSIAAPTAMAAGSQIATGCSGCGGNPQCISNHCCQGNPGKACNQGCCVGNNNSCHFCGCVGGTCNCTVTPSEADIPQCPCVCSDPGCTGPCCPAGQVCCVNQVPVGCD